MNDNRFMNRFIKITNERIFQIRKYYLILTLMFEKLIYNKLSKRERKKYSSQFFVEIIDAD